MFISSNENQTVFCQVSPNCQGYITEYPLWTFYNDESFSRLYQQAHFRSPVGKLRKPREEFTLADIRKIIYCNEKPENIYSNLSKYKSDNSCNKCGKPNLSGSRICSQCGYIIEIDNYCFEHD